MKTYKVDFESHIRQLWPTLLLLFLIPIGVHFLTSLRSSTYTFENKLIITLVVYVVYILPTFILHLNYYYFSKKKRFIVDNQTAEYAYQVGTSKTSFSNNDIQYIVSYKTRPLAENRTPILSWDWYNYSIIFLKDDKKIVLTSLLINEVDKVLDTSEIRVKKSFYPWVAFKS